LKIVGGNGITKWGGDRHEFLAVSNDFRFAIEDVVDVFVGTASNIRGNKTIAFRRRFKGVRVEGGEERFLVRPIVGSEREMSVISS
jgi:hypothetical protein